MDIYIDNIEALSKMKINFTRLAVFKYDANVISSGRLDQKFRIINNMYLVTGGRARYTQPKLDNYCDASENDIVLLPYASAYQAKFTLEKSVCSGICLDFMVIDENGNNIILPPKIRLMTSDTDGYYRSQYNTAIQRQMNAQDDFAFRSTVYNIFSNLFNDIHRFSSSDSIYNEISYAIHSIERTPQSNESVAQLAVKCGISETGLRSKFRKYTGGMNPVDYRNYLRVKKARELLMETDCSVEVIAESLGFYDSSYFIKIFKRLSGRTPNEFRAGE